MKQISWGVISTARIGTEKVIPAMQMASNLTVTAIGSRNLDSAKKAATTLGIMHAFGSYEEVVNRTDIDAVYIPLPNHLHVEWSIKAIRAGKHVLCEKPIGRNAEEARVVMREAQLHPELKVMEAFMYRFHPQTAALLELINEGAIGDVRNVQTMFSYYNVNPKDVRNQADIGGGGLLDIGCYCISYSRLLFGEEPLRVSATIEYDPALKVDRLVSAAIEFSKGSATFTCSTQLPNSQHAKIIGTRGIIDAPIPFTPPPDRPSRLIVASGPQEEVIAIEPANHYTLQGEAFSKSILDKTPVPTPFSDAIANMKVIDAIFESSRTGRWVSISPEGRL